MRKMVELTKERIVIIISVVILIIAFGLYIFLYGPLISKCRLTYRDCKDLEAKVLQARNSIASLKATPAKIGLISQKDVSFAIDELTKEGSLKEINFISITPKQTEDQVAAYKIFPIEMEIESSYENLAIFLGRLDDLEKSLVKVRKFDVTPELLNTKILTTGVSIDIYLENAE